jgi:hypothetical protein
MTANSTPESHDAVVAEMRGHWCDLSMAEVNRYADRLQSAHARELAEDIG